MQIPDSVTNFMRKVIDEIDNKFSEAATYIGTAIGLSPSASLKLKFGMEIVFGVVLFLSLFQ